MINEARKLREEYEKKLKALQESCPHPETKWTRYMWAPGHRSPNKVRVCLRCDKILEREKRSVQIE